MITHQGMSLFLHLMSQPLCTLVGGFFRNILNYQNSTTEKTKITGFQKSITYLLRRQPSRDRIQHGLKAIVLLLRCRSNVGRAQPAPQSQCSTVGPYHVPQAQYRVLRPSHDRVSASTTTDSESMPWQQGDNPSRTIKGREQS
jgi:hypothetical protein